MKAKSIFKIIGFVLAFLICCIVVLVFVVDANSFKPRIEAAAREQGIALAMRGDVHWAFWPSIGLAVNQVSVGALNEPKPIADLNKASFLVAFLPLMRGDIQVKHILVDGANIDLQVDKNGEGNWQKLLKQKDENAQQKPVETTTEKSRDFKLAIEKISVQHSQLIYSNEQSASHYELKDITLDVTDVNLDGKAFPMDAAWETRINDAAAGALPLIIKTQLKQKVTLDKEFASIKLTDGNLALELKKAGEAKLKFKYAFTLDDIKKGVIYKGDFTSDTFNARDLLAAFGTHLKTANAKALSEVKFATKIAGDNKQAALNNLQIDLDKTHFTGTVAIPSFSEKAIKLALQGDEINVDDYLAPKPDEKTPVAAPSATGDEPLIPVDVLRKLNADIQLGIKKLQFADLHLSDLHVDAEAHDGVLQEQIKAAAYSGTINHKATVDARNQAAHIQFENNVQAVEIAPILKDKKLDKSLHLSGSVQLEGQGSATGNTKNQIMDSLVANANLSGAKVRLAPLNLEQQFCKLVALVNRSEPAAQEWAGYTELRELSGKIAIAKRVVNIQMLNAGVEKLLLSSTGNINLANGSYDFALPLKLVRDATDTPTSITTSEHGCAVNSNYWAERSLTLLRCKGTYKEIDPKEDCRPDKDMVVALTKDYAEYKIKEKHGAKIEAKKEELIKKLDDKLGGEGKADQAKALLKNLLKKKDDK